MKPPCKQDCPFRSAECRLECLEWLEYVKQRNAEYQKRQHERDRENHYREYVSDSIKRMKNGKGRKRR